MEFLGQNNQGCDAQVLSESLQIPKSTLFRYLATLEERGYVRKNPDNGKYALGLKVLELSNQALGQITIHEVALPYMRELRDRFQETVNLAVLEGCEIAYIQILDSPRAFRMSSKVGERDDVHATSLGKAILAFLPEEEVDRIARVTGLPARTENTITSLPRLKEELAMIRHRGYAVDRGENEEGASCVGAPVFDHRGIPIAAISLSGPTLRFSPPTFEEMGAELINVVSEISQKIGHSTHQ